MAGLERWLPEIPLSLASGAELPEALGGFEGRLPVDPSTQTRLRTAVLSRCLDALAPHALQLPRALVLGAGTRGRDAVQALLARGLEVSVWDPSPERARALADEIAVPLQAQPWTDSAAELLVPCLPDAIIDEARASALRATVVCGPSPRVLASAEAGERLRDRGVWVVPPALAATAEPLGPPHAEGLLAIETSLEQISQTARLVLETREGAQQRAVNLAIERSKSSGRAQGS